MPSVAAETRVARRTGEARDPLRLSQAMKTFSATPSDIEQRWYIVDADGMVLGRLATEVARIICRMAMRRSDPTTTPAGEPRFAAYHQSDDGALVEQAGLWFEDCQPGETCIHAPRRCFHREEAFAHAWHSLDLTPYDHVPETFVVAVATAWLATNPFNNPNAPPGPLFMPQYKVSLDDKANQLEAQAAKTFDDGQVAKEQGDAYVLNTVFLATVLFLTAIAENFQWNTVRAVILIVALGMLLFGIYHLVIYPII